MDQAKGLGSVLPVVEGLLQVVLVEHAGLVSLSVDGLSPKHRLPPRSRSRGSFQRTVLLPMLYPMQYHPPKAKIRPA